MDGGADLMSGRAWRVMAALAVMGWTAPAARAAEEPSLPAGLETPAASGEPAVPAGLGTGAAEPGLPEGLGTGEPALPGGLEGADAEKPLPAEAQRARLRDALSFSGFWEARGGYRTQADRYEDSMSLGETRLHLEAETAVDALRFKVAPDFLYDHVADDRNVDLHSGEGWLDLREAWVSGRPAEWMDVKAGRQILTWGTGDLVFINDLFPKDWVSFFIGRDVAYLKAPSDAVKASFFSDAANVDIVYTPQFDPDRYIDGRRISYYNAGLGRIAGRDAIVHADTPDDWLADDEIAARVYRNAGGYELALYGYEGFWKSPNGMDPATLRATFPALGVYGASARGQAGRGIGNVEAGYYDSRDDRDGDDPFVANSQARFLAGYEQDLKEVARDLTVGVQYYLEYMRDYDEYRSALPAGTLATDENRHVLTLRVTKLLMDQNLTLSLFTFWSPSDEDAYLRPLVSYKLNDSWTADFGANVFLGEDDHTFFGQFEDNANIYAGLRYGF